MDASIRIDPKTGQRVNIDPATGQRVKSKPQPSIAQMVAPGTSEYVSEAMETEGGTMMAPEMEPGQSDEEHKASVEDWQANNRKQLSKATHAVMGDASTLLSRAWGTTVGKLGQKFGWDAPAKIVSGKDQPTAAEMMAEPSTSILRPVNAFGEKQLELGNKALGFGALALGSMDSPNPLNVLKGGAKGIGKVASKVPVVGAPAVDVVSDVVAKGNKAIEGSVVSPIADKVMGMPPGTHNVLAKVPKNLENKITDFVTNIDSKYTDIEPLADKISKLNKIDKDKLAAAIKEYKTDYVDHINKIKMEKIAGGMTEEQAAKYIRSLNKKTKGLMLEQEFISKLMIPAMKIESRTPVSED